MQLRTPMARLTRHWRFPRAAERLRESAAAERPDPSAYEDLMRYFATGWAVYRTSEGSGADYPGRPSYYDRSADRIEGFSRIMPLFAAWCASGRPGEIRLADGSVLSLPEAFRKGLVAGTHPGSRGYWGGVSGTATNQRSVEAADIALALWLFRDSVWRQLQQAEQEAAIVWLAQVGRQPVLDNNWHLFPVLIDRVLTALGHPGLVAGAREHHERIKAFHLGDGWFSDGPDGRIDFYNAWGFHYLLSWIDRIDPAWDPSFIQACQRSFVSSYRYLIGPRGLPIMGRSIPYRLAAPAPLVAAAEASPDLIPPGEARRGLDCVWSYFIRRGALRYGAPTQGYFGPDPRVVDRYSGPASSLWSLRSLVMAFWLSPRHAFWRAAPAPLPVETKDYMLTAAGGRWRVHGDRRRRAITIEIPENPAGAAPALEPFSRLHALRNLMWGQPPRPHSIDAKYGHRCYASDRPFCLGKAGDARGVDLRTARLLPARGGPARP